MCTQCRHYYDQPQSPLTMQAFTIKSCFSWYTHPVTGSSERGVFLKSDISAYYHDDYHSGDPSYRSTQGTVENIITTLKNQFGNTSIDLLERTSEDMLDILKRDLPLILSLSGKEELTICVIPRSKAESSYLPTQLFLKKTIKAYATDQDGFQDGTDYIIRHTDTKTTHMSKSCYGGTGDMPYPGITKATCTISEEVRGKDILLIDDLYTEGVNIDEDAIQAFLDNGAGSVIFYSLGKTLKRSNQQ